MYTICVNMPGCLPEMEPYSVDDLDSAREALVNELERTADGYDSDEEREALGDAIEQAHKLGSNGGSIEFAGYAHEIGLTDAEQEARDLAKLDCQIWDNLPAGAQQRYRDEARDREED